MVNNVMTGKGNYLDIHTGVYEGTFQNGKLTGSGCTVKRKSNEYGNYSINGTFLNDLPHGHLTFSHPIKKQLKRDQYGDIIRLPTDPQHQQKTDIESGTLSTNTGNTGMGDAAAEAGKVVYEGKYVDGVRHGLMKASGGTNIKENRFIYEGKRIIVLLKM